MTIQAPELEQIQQKNATARVARAERDVQNKKENRSILKSMLPSFGVGLFDFLGNLALQEKAQRNYKENQRDLFKYNQAAEKNAASNAVEGLRKAGLSTALATGGDAMSTAAVSAPSASSHSPAPAPGTGKLGPENALMAQENLLVQREAQVKSAQASLLESQKLGQDLANENQLGANFVVQQSWTSMIDNFIADADNRGDVNTISSLEALRDGLTPYLNAGAYQFMQGMLAGSADYSKAVHQRLSSYLDDLVLNKQINSEQIISELALAPYLQNQEVRAHIVELGSAAVMMASQADLNNANAANSRALNPAYKKALDKVLADIRESGVRADQIHNSDLQTAVKNGDWGRVGSIATEDAVKIGLNALGFYFGGRGLAAGRAAAKNVAPAAPAAPAAPVAPSPYGNIQVGETRKAISAQKAAKQQADIKKAYETYDNWYSGYKQGVSGREHNDNIPRRRPKTDAFGHKIDYRLKENRNKR